MPVRYFARLDFLEPQLAEAEHLIDHLLREVLHAVDFSREILLVLFRLRIGRRRGGGGRLAALSGQRKTRARGNHGSSGEQQHPAHEDTSNRLECDHFRGS